jgi:hypothetical protein
MVMEISADVRMMSFVPSSGESVRGSDHEVGGEELGMGGLTAEVFLEDGDWQFCDADKS